MMLRRFLSGPIWVSEGTHSPGGRSDGAWPTWYPLHVVDGPVQWRNGQGQMQGVNSSLNTNVSRVFFSKFLLYFDNSNTIFQTDTHELQHQTTNFLYTLTADLKLLHQLIFSRLGLGAHV